VCSRDEQDVKRQTEALLKRDAARKKYDPEYNADDIIGDDTPAEAMQPTFKDPALWRIQCKQGQENEACVQLMRRFFERQHTDAPLLIKSAVANAIPTGSKSKSYIYIEAFKQAHVKEAIKGLAALQYGQWKQEMVPRAGQDNCLRVVRKQPLKAGSWIRMKGSLYNADIARVSGLCLGGDVGILGCFGCNG